MKLESNQVNGNNAKIPTKKTRILIQIYFFSNSSRKCQPIAITKTRDSPSIPCTRKASITHCVRCFHRVVCSSNCHIIPIVDQTRHQYLKLFVQLVRHWVLLKFWRHSLPVWPLLVSIEHVRNIAPIDSIGPFSILLWKSILASSCPQTN